MAETEDLKSFQCRFESGHRHQQLSPTLHIDNPAPLASLDRMAEPAALPNHPLSERNLTRVIYALHAVGLLVAGLTNVLAVIIHYLKVGSLTTPLARNHFRWQIQTFWVGCAWLLLGLATSIFLIGIPVMVIAWLWMVYRYAKGWLALEDGRPATPYPPVLT